MSERMLSIQQSTESVHHLQRERGITCGLMGAHGNQRLVQYFATRVVEQRRQTDTFLSDATTLGTLQSIREDADEFSHHTNSSQAASTFYSIFTRFNSLISGLLEASSGNEIYDAFARLKEATGIERAFLCGALALPASALAHLPSRAFADLVIGMQQQRSYEATIRDAAPPKLLELIRAGFEYSPELREVQSHLLENFDVGSLRETLGADRCWQMLTDHIDKLERLQLLLLSELDAQRGNENATEGALHEAIAALSAQSGGLDLDAPSEGAAATMRIASALSSIQRQPADGLKKELIRLLIEARNAARASEADTRNAARAARGSREQQLPRSARNSLERMDEGSYEDSLHGTRALLGRHAPEERLIGLDELVFRKRVGSGSAGATYLATFEGSTVAVKIATGSGGIEDWKREVQALSHLQHPRIIRCIGIIAATPSFGLVLEYCEGGDLSTRLTKPTPPGFVLHVARGVTAGMMHLHHRGVLHRDLKGANLLLDGSGEVKITDFGLAAFAPDDTRTGGWLTAETGTYRWMAPEVCLHEQYSRSADVFSFGCVLFELVTHEVPWADRTPLQAAVAFGLDNLRPTLPDGIPTPVAQLIYSCWLRDASARPTFASIHTQLEVVSEGLTPLEHTWLDASNGHPVYAQPAQQAATPLSNGLKAALSRLGFSSTMQRLNSLQRGVFQRSWLPLHVALGMTIGIVVYSRT